MCPFSPEFSSDPKMGVKGKEIDKSERVVT